MNLTRLIAREIAHRKTGFVLAVLAVAAAVSCFAAGIMLLRTHDRETERLAASMNKRAEAELKDLEDDIRRSMKGLGFNIHIYPEGQNLGEVYSQGFASKTMPESNVNVLAESKLVTINHLLPSLTQKVEWPEKKRTVVLIGTRGEVPIAHRTPKSPLIQPVDPGTLVLGYELHESLGLKEGDSVDFRGRPFKVAKTHRQRGSVDDITVWMDLAEAQAMLEKPGLINSILALECNNCETEDLLGNVRAEVASLLPNTQVVEIKSTALARAEARDRARELSESRLAELKKAREEMRNEREGVFAWLVPLVAIACMVWIGYLAFTNVQQRFSEVGALRALGLKSSGLLYLFLGRAVLVGLAGAAFGLIIAALLGVFGNLAFLAVLESVLVLLSAVLFAALAAWLPALSASQRDPASILRHD